MPLLSQGTCGVKGPGRVSNYRPEIDGLRALSILGVVLFHIGVCPGGYTGVDVFFVISGYLISGLLLGEVLAGKFSLRQFWMRRIRRLAPALLLVSATTYALGFWLLLPEDLSELGNSLASLWTLTANVFFYYHTGYFQGDAETKPLLHAWSLAVEEQFYLVFPLIFFASKHHRLTGLSQIAVLSFGWGLWRLESQPSESFYLMPGRAWELLLGAILALLPGPKGSGIRETASLIGLACIAFCFFSFDASTRFPGLAAIVPCGGAALFLVANSQGRTRSGNVLATKPLVRCGQLSYAWYLWHWPLLAFSRYWALTPMEPLVGCGLLGVGLALAWMTYLLVEDPIRGGRRLASTRRLLAVCLALAACLALLGFGTSAHRGWPQRFPALALQLAATGAKEGRWPELDSKSIAQGQYARLGMDGSGPVHFFLWGDSHCNHWFALLNEQARRTGKRGLGALYPATPPILNYNPKLKTSLGSRSASYNQKVLQTIRDLNVPHVILGARWNWNLFPDQGFEAGFQRTLVALGELPCEVWVLKQMPEQPYSVPRALSRVVRFGGDFDQLGVTLSEYQQQSQRFDRLMEQHRRPRIHLVDPTQLCFQGRQRCRLIDQGRALYLDTDHATARVAEMLYPQLASIFEGPTTAR